MEKNSMIEVNRLMKLFDGFPALDSVDMSVPKGSIYGLVGPNGAGKTTLIRHLAGIYRQDKGEILIDGQPVYENPAIKSRVAYIPDDLYFFPQATVLEMRRYYEGVFPRFDGERFSRLGQAFPIDPSKPIRRLSKGMQKQVAFWIAICTSPDIVLLDEPVDGLDPVMRRQVWGLLMDDVAQRGVTVLVSSHNLRELEDVCDHVGIMHKGRVVLERSLSELQGNTLKIQAAFPGDQPQLPKDLEILHQARMGRVFTLIVRGRQEEILPRFAECRPLFVEALPLTLEEIFIYELGGMDYEVKDIVL